MVLNYTYARTTDEVTWQKVRKRADFQRILVFYFVINAFLWFIWWFIAGSSGYNRETPWPIWSMLGWRIELPFQYLNAYGVTKNDQVEKEYEKLKNKS